MPTSQPTPEDIEAARTLVATADAAADKARKAGVIANLQPLIAAGFGAENAVVDLAALSAVMPANYAALAEIDPNLPSSVMTVARLNQSINDRIRNLVALNSPPTAA
ncbi:Uncharacterised protein [Brevundimonas vesicularis]|uniref:Uncharacterized protein n=1 Tax=Brevundimonas vesicularis TaxID=41276 RepID=A0A2X1BEI0_BREVE|nr:hypothetical protein [Brevundimonas vesicularis]SPU55863.1 Uncharacterised protein [Brevundimonas vesicularis]